jgi:hypothetical protein
MIDIRLVTGHDFSRAAKGRPMRPALAAARAAKAKVDEKCAFAGAEAP